MLRYFNFKLSFRRQLCRARDLFGSLIPVTTGCFELRISCIQSSYLTHYAIRPSGFGNYFVCILKKFEVQTLLWSMEFVIQINVELDQLLKVYFLNIEQLSLFFFFSENKVKKEIILDLLLD